MEFKLNDTDVEYLTEEVYDIIRTIKDPEFPNTLEELNVVDPSLVTIQINELRKWVIVVITWVPTTPSCGFAMNIALSMRVKL